MAELFYRRCTNGRGPVRGTYLASSGWNPESVGFALTFSGLVTVAMQTPAGAVIDATRRKRLLLITSLSGFDWQFGKNQAFNSAGNVFTAGLVAWASYKFGYRAIFVVAALFAIPAAACLLGIDDTQIDYARARGISVEKGSGKAEAISDLLRDRVLLKFLVAVFLFHLANAAMLPELGEMLSRNNPRAAAPFMPACIIVTQIIIAISAA